MARKRFKCRPITQAIEVSDVRLREIYKEHRFPERWDAGEFTMFERYSHHPTPPPAKEPECTQTQMVSLLDHEGYRIVNLHQFKRRTGEIGASGQPDPKAIQIQDVLYYVAAEP